MRLLRYRDLNFEEFEVDTAPRYAILSHTWYQDHEEIKKCGEIAADNGYAYFWVDTCCIDKSSSAELSEAINSMYLWYKHAAVCYAYFTDMPIISFASTLPVFRRLKWFKRGWTLQELLAPADVIFLSKEWEILGSKDDFKDIIEAATGIPTTALEGMALGQFSVAERMSWAARRETKRVEDIAYSLMGIFDVHMPLFYGERGKAFVRLQEEIMKSSDDQSIFAWKAPNTSFPAELHLGLLADSPDCFVQSKNIFPLGSLSRAGTFVTTNKGIKVTLFVMKVPGAHNLYIASLDCRIGNSIGCSPGIYLKRLTGSENSWGSSSQTQFARTRRSQMELLQSRQKVSGTYRELYIRQRHDSTMTQQLDLNSKTLFYICEPPMTMWTGIHWSYNRVFPLGCWDEQTRILTPFQTSGKLGGFTFNYRESFFLVVFGIYLLGNPWIQIVQTNSPDGLGAWEFFEPSGIEASDSQLIHVVDQTRTNFSVSIRRVQLYETPLVSVELLINEQLFWPSSLDAKS